MAMPKWHALPTGILAIVSWKLFRPAKIWSENTLILVLVIGFGFFVDLDHIFPMRMKKIFPRIKDMWYRKKKLLDKGRINWMHTWPALTGVVFISAILGNFLPLVSYGLHILIDAGDRAHRIYRVSPLPKYLHQFYPDALTYETKEHKPKQVPSG